MPEFARDRRRRGLFVVPPLVWTWRALRGAPALVLLGIFRLWQLLVSPTYGVQAVRMHGALRGGGLTLWRVLRCNPWNPGGVDLVPPVEGTSTPCLDEPAPPARRAA